MRPSPAREDSAEWSQAFSFDFKRHDQLLGCRVAGEPKIGHCAECKMRSCATQKGPPPARLWDFSPAVRSRASSASRRPRRTSRSCVPEDAAGRIFAPGDPRLAGEGGSRLSSARHVVSSAAHRGSWPRPRRTRTARKHLHVLLLPCFRRPRSTPISRAVDRAMLRLEPVGEDRVSFVACMFGYSRRT